MSASTSPAEALFVVSCLSEAAQEALDWFDLEPADHVATDLDALRSGEFTPSSMLADILDGNTEPETEQGWRDYVATLEAHLAKEHAR
jgi:hypothetical protein